MSARYDFAAGDRIPKFIGGGRRVKCPICGRTAAQDGPVYLHAVEVEQVKPFPVVRSFADERCTDPANLAGRP